MPNKNVRNRSAAPRTAPRARIGGAQAHDRRLELLCRLSVRPQNGGFFVSRGRGIHPRRILPSYELIFVQKGELHIREERRRFVVQSGEALVLWPGRLHAGTRQFSPDLRFYWVHFDVDRLPAAGRGAAPPLRLQARQKVALGRPERMEELFRRFLDDQEAGALNPLRAALYVTLLLGELAGSGEHAEGRKHPTPGRVHANRLDQFIRTHFHEAISTASIARELHCNPDYLGRVYRQAYGRTITDAIHQMRIAHARALLRDSDANINEVAYESGFSDAGYFRRMFRRAEGLTPSRYRQAFSRMHINTA